MIDFISRQAAIEAVEHITSSMSVCVNTDECHGMKRMQRQAVIELANLSSAQPEIEERTEEFAQNVPKEDLISRKEAIDAECEVCQIAPKKERGHNCTYYVHGCKEIECLRALPSAQPDGWLEQNKDKILQAGMEGREIDFRIGGRLFAIREKAQ